MIESVLLAWSLIATEEPQSTPRITAASVLTVSHHGKRDPDYNEVNPGLILEAGNWHFGAYRNTFRRTTVFLVRDWTIASGDSWAFSFQAGPATGYSFPAIAFFRARYGPVSLYFLPPIANHKHVAALAFRWELR